MCSIRREKPGDNGALLLPVGEEARPLAGTQHIPGESGGGRRLFPAF